MPFFEPAKRLTQFQNLPLQPEDAPDDPSLMETFGAAFRTQNVIGSAIMMQGIPDPSVAEDGFNAIDYIKDDPRYGPYVEDFAGILNRRSADAMKAKIDQEERDNRTIDAAGFLGTIASGVAGIVDLPTLIPVGGTLANGIRGGLSGAVRLGIGAGLDAGISEIGLQATQATRTGTESALNIGGSVVLGGALGGLIGKYLSREEASALSKKIEGQEAEFEQFDRAFVGTPQSAGAAARGAGPLTLKDEQIISRLPLVNRQDPLIRLQLSELNAGRETVRRMAETPLEYAENASGIATERGGAVETRIKMWNAPLSDGLQQIDTLFARYFHNTPEPSTIQRVLSPARSEFDRLRGRTDKLTFRQFKEEVGRAAYMNEQHSIPEVAEAARVYRSLDERMKRAAIEAGLFPEDVKVAGDVSHRFRMYNRQRIIAKRDEFARILNDHFIQKRDNAASQADLLRRSDPLDEKAASALDEYGRLSNAEVKDAVNETINTILGQAEGRMPYDIAAGPRGALKDRVLKIETAKIHDFVVNDIEEVMRAQFRTMAADVELAKKFGSVDLKEQIRKINDEADARIDAAKDEADRRRLDAQRKRDIRDVEGIRDRLRGTYALPDNPDGIVLRAARVMRNINYLRLLGGMTISALPDMGSVVIKHGMASTFRDGFLPLIRNLKAVRLAANEVKAAGTALDMVLDSRVMAMADIMDAYGHHSKFERGLAAASSRFGIVSLMAPWNASLKQFAGIVTMTNLLRSADKLAKGKANSAEIRKLAAAGIDEDLAQRITSEFATHGEVTDGVYLAKAANWTDQEAQEAFRAAIVRDVDRIIVTPGQDKPLWMSTELGKTLGQFKSFGISSMQKIVLSGLQQRDAATLNGVMLMMSLGAVVYALKQSGAEQPTSDSAAVWSVEALDKSGLTGWLMDANNISEKLTRGRVGMSAFTGKPISRYASRNASGAFFGPTPDAIDDIFQISSSVFAGDTSMSDLRKARKFVPGQNLFYLRGLFDQVEKATGSAMGLPEKKSK